MEKRNLTLLGLSLVFITKSTIGLFIFSSQEIASDAKDYFEFAQLILRDGPLTLAQSEIEAFAPPGFPWLLALTKYLTGWIGFIVIVNAFLSTATIWVIYKISECILPRAWAILPTIWTVFYIPYSFYIGSVLKESLLQFLIPFSVYLLLRLHYKVSLLFLISLCFIYTYTIHTDERYIVFLPLYLFPLIQRNSLRSSFKNCTLFILGILVFSSPWFIRNYQVYERPILITERFQSPIDKKLGVENRLNERKANSRDQLISFRDSVLSGHSPRVNSGGERAIEKAIADGLIPHDYSLKERLYYNTLGYWSPIRTSGILLRNGWKYKGPRTLAVNSLYAINYGILLPFMIFGIFFAWDQKNRVLQWLSIYIFIHYALHVIMIFGSGRYRHPVDFIIIILAFYGLYCICRMKNWGGVDHLYKQISRLLKAPR